MSKAVVSAAAPGLPTSRRTLLATLAGTGAALSLPKLAKAAEVATISEADPAHPDAALLALRPRAKAVQARLDASCDRLGAADLLRFARKSSPDAEAAEAEQDAAGEAWGELRDEIVAAPVSTLAGLRFKATWAPGLWDDTDVMQALVEDIVAMAGGAQA